jgi:hypothetical protein
LGWLTSQILQHDMPLQHKPSGADKQGNITAQHLVL